MSDMIILQVLPALDIGGVERGTIEIAAALTKQGIKNYVISNGGKMVPELERLGCEHIQLPVHSKNPLRMYLNARHIAKIVREKGITLIHVRSRAPAWSVKWASRMTRVPFMTTFHGVYGIKPAIKKYYNVVMTQGVRMIAVSQHVKNQVLRDYQIDESKIRLIHRGADIDRFNPDKVSQNQIEALIKAYQIPEDKPIILLPGRLSQWKGQLAMIEALEHMRHKEITLLLVGSDQGRKAYVADLNAAIKRLPEQTRVLIFALPGKSMPVVNALSNIVVAPSLKPEPFGRTITEAQAMGKIVVAFNHGGAVETIEDGKTGFVVAPGDIAALAAKLDAILDMPADECKKIQMAAQESVRTHFSVQKMQEKTIAVYKELHDGRKRC
ncbi:MAG: glycosyltransferase family 4 protein [Alphaproteobacteria bacterium]